MNFFGGKVVSNSELREILGQLPQRISNTLAKELLNPQIVINAFHALAEKISLEEVEEATAFFMGNNAFLQGIYNSLKKEFSKEYLTQRLQVELGESYFTPKEYCPSFSSSRVREQKLPLGVLLHIPAGNAVALSVLSVLEGLLTGNINLVKLPTNDMGISVHLFKMLVEIEPMLAEYIFAFDYPSEEKDNIKELEKQANAVVLWGSDRAVSSIREMLSPNTKLIIWGHKISFSYINTAALTDNMLEELAESIAHTKGALCTSAQGIYLNTDDLEEIKAFLERFLTVLEGLEDKGQILNMEEQAQNTLLRQNAILKGIIKREHCFVSKTGYTLVADENAQLVPSISGQILWVKPLPQEKIISVLHPNKEYLQTVALLCKEREKYNELASLLAKAGVARITTGKNMSLGYVGEPHDGRYPLQEYTRTVSVVVEDTQKEQFVV